MPKISIITPAYNASESISDSIASVIQQSFYHWELLIFDDASTDNSVEIINSFNDSRIKLYTGKKNQGPGKARDFLIRKASGKWVAVLDADDTYEPTRLEKFYEIAKQNPDAIIFDEIMECHDSLKGMVPWRTVRDLDFLVHKRNAHNISGAEISPARWLSCDRTMMQWMAPVELIKKHNILHPDVRFGEDLGFILRLISATKAPLFYIPQPLYLCRLRSGSLTSASNRFDVLLNVLNEAKGYPGLNAETLLALDHKIKSIEKRLTYQKFLTAVLTYKFKAVAVECINNPWVVAEFAKRVFERIPYHLHRKFHKASKRETI